MSVATAPARKSTRGLKATAAKAMKPEVKTETAPATTKAPIAPVARLWVSNGGVTKCDLHGGKYLTAAIKASPRKRTHTTNLDAWGMQNLKNTAKADLDMQCETCGAGLVAMSEGNFQFKKAARPGKKAEVATPAPKREAKKAEPKPEVAVEPEAEEKTFYAVKFSDGYFLKRKTSANLHYTPSFREAREFKTYDGAVKVVEAIQSEYDAEDVGNILYVVRVTLSGNPLKVNTRRMGVLPY